MTAPECRRPTVTNVTKRQTCLEALAAGWINPPDLCPTCTQAFMTALDGITGPLVWHRNYLARAMTDETDGTNV